MTRSPKTRCSGDSSRAAASLGRRSTTCTRATSSRGLNEGLGEVVISAHGKADQQVDLLGASGQHEHVAVGEGPHLPANLHAVQPRQTQVQDDDLRVDRASLGDGVSSVVRDVHVVSRSFEVGRNHPREVLLVLDDQDARSLGLTAVAHTFSLLGGVLSARCRGGRGEDLRQIFMSTASVLQQAGGSWCT
jgi:hypothetical protein